MTFYRCIVTLSGVLMGRQYLLSPVVYLECAKEGGGLGRARYSGDGGVQGQNSGSGSGKLKVFCY